MVSKGLEQPYMASRIPWFWVLEALGHMKQVDPSLLIELVEKTPDISEDLGRNAREIVSLRILESLDARGTLNKDNGIPQPGSQIGFDSSACCEDVLHHIIQGASAANPKLDGPEISECDVHSFVVQKNSLLPSCCLQQLKHGILEGSNPLLAMLKDGSGLAVSNESQKEIPTDRGDSNGIAHGEGTHIVEPKRKSLSFTTTEDKLLQESSPRTNLLPAKRDRTTTDVENCEGQSHEFHMTYEEASKKLKPNSSSMQKNIPRISIIGHQQPSSLDSLAQTLEHIEEHGVSEKEPQIGHVDASNSSADHHCDHDASTRPTSNSGMESYDIMLCQQQFPQNSNRAPKEASRDGNVQNDNIHVAKGINEGSLEPATVNGTVHGVTREENRVDEADNEHLGIFEQNAADGAKTKFDNKHGNVTDTSSESEEYHDESIGIATKKNAFLSSQCTFTQDSLGTQLNLCVKCQKNGDLLVCNSNTCPVAVHENCLGSVANFDGKGNFYCPFCAYSQAISRYLEAKKSASMTRKDLSAFIGMGVEKKLKRSSSRLQRSKQNLLREDVNLDPNNETNMRGSPYVVNNPQSPQSMLHRKEVEPIESCPSDNPHIEKEGDVTNEPLHVPATSSQMSREQGKGQAARSISHKSNGELLQCMDPEISHSSERPDQMRGVLHQSESDPSQEPCGSSDSKSSEEGNEKVVTSRYSIRFRKPEKQYAYPAIPQLRRKKNPWTKEEEDTLKEGVQRFSSDNDRSIPWKKIWEFGSDTFQKGRTAMDLRDKWRNICKGSPKPK